MKIVISSGHGKYIRGASGYLDEVDEARKVVDEVARMLSAEGAQTTTFHDNVSTSQDENLHRIVDFHNSKTRDWDVSVHFNAYETTSKAMGSEVLYISEKGEEMADDVVDAICAVGFVNRGPKYRSDLYFLNNTNQPAILIETCFVDSKADHDLYKKKFADVCAAIASALIGADVAPGPTPPQPVRPEPGDERETIGVGDEGDDVAALQHSLGCLVEDGDFGPTTEAWVRGFQAACGVTADGVVGPVSWAEVNELDARVRDAANRLTDVQVDHIVELARGSPLMGYSWRDRGKAPKGYIPGMACCFGATVLSYGAKEPFALAQAAAEAGLEEIDALAWYAAEFAALGMDNDRMGLDTLRHLHVLMIGLGMRESSGKYCEGRDLSADNVASDTAEAGLMQTSWNIATADSSIPPLLTYAWENPAGYRDVFAEGITATKDNLNCYGGGNGAKYQFLARFAPAFAVAVTGVGLRTRRQHWGPINRQEAELRQEADTLLLAVQRYVLSGGSDV